ncbi:hypothetical protein FRACA_410002 [Frankia canadensis]|uniref:Uncharacterized protein n=1 Tax=Frankia canadensis TaxID=1836972 RepID=A0A2I2KWS0_9ACTN|nr:hypothetical protein FRACA_410002 [Frankia canadensis]SOU57417.1 hypothetical protein FRACA_410002 [Frankia canadensis]
MDEPYGRIRASRLAPGHRLRPGRARGRATFRSRLRPPPEEHASLPARSERDGVPGLRRTGLGTGGAGRHALHRLILGDHPGWDQRRPRDGRLQPREPARHRRRAEHSPAPGHRSHRPPHPGGKPLASPSSQTNGHAGWVCHIERNARNAQPPAPLLKPGARLRLGRIAVQTGRREARAGELGTAEHISELYEGLPAEEHVIAGLGVVRVDSLWADLQVDQFAAAVHGRGHQATARAALDPSLGELPLRVDHRGLHLLRLLEERPEASGRVAAEPADRLPGIRHGHGPQSVAGAFASATD